MDFRDSVIEAARGWACANLDTADRINGLFSSVSLSGGGAAVGIGDLANDINNAGRALLACPASGGPYASAAGPGFSGGQCPENYEVTWEFTYFRSFFNDNDTITRTDTLLGPISGIRNVFENDTITVFIDHAGTSTEVQAVTASLGTVSPVSESILGVSLESGGVDNCGDFGYDPSNPPISNQPITYDGPDGNPVTENVGITLNPPVVLPNGDVVIPVCVTGPGWEICVNIPTDGGDPSLGPPDADLGAEACCPTPTETADPPEGEEPPPEEDENGPIIGVVVVTTSVGTSARPTEKSVGTGPTLNVPRLGTVHFGISAGGARAWLNIIDIKNKRCFVPVPHGLTAIAVEVNPVHNVEFDVTVVYQRQIVPQ